MNKGRPLDPIWEHFERKDGNKAKCLECGSESAALVERMRTHFNKYHVAKDEETPTPRKQIKIEKFVVKTTKLDKDKFDVSVAKFFYANNISFNCVDSVTFKNLVNHLHPGYKPPNRKRLAGELLDTVCAEHDDFKKIGDVKITNFVKAQVLLGNLSEKLGNISEQLMAMVPSSAGLERIFSSMGYIHSEIRNRLDPEKVRKLAFCMRLLSSAANLEKCLYFSIELKVQIETLF